MRCVVDLLPSKYQGPERFGPYRVSAGELISKTDFFLKFGSGLHLSAVEAELLYERAMGPDLKPAYHFFTYFDSFVSTQSTPFPYKHNPSAPVDLRRQFQELATDWTDPPAKYGFSLTEEVDIEGTAGRLTEIFSHAADVYEVMLRVLRTDRPLRLYHLLSVLDSYRDVPHTLMYEPQSAFNKLHHYFRPHFPVGLWFYQKFSLSLDTTVNKGGLQRHLNFLPTDLVNEVFCFLDNHHKGYIFIHQFCTLADICSQNAGQLQFFPYWHNRRTPKDLRTLMTQLARNLDDFQKSAAEYYKGDLLERQYLPTLKQALANDMLASEAETVFTVMELNRCGFTYLYHWVSALESFCKAPRMEQAVRVENPRLTIYSIFARVPVVVSSLKLLEVSDLSSLLDLTGCARLLRRLQPSSAQLQYLFSLADTCSHSFVFAYQFLTAVDMHRACLEGDSVVKELPRLPFKGTRNSSVTEWERLAESLDHEHKPTWEFDWGVVKESELSSGQFVKALSRYFTRPVEVFAQLALGADGLCNFYVFLAVLESYRTYWVNPAKPESLEKKQTNLTPLQDALDKLSRYLGGENELKRKLTAVEIFGTLDINKDGSVTRDELFTCLNKMPIDLTPRQKELLLREADLNRNNRIDYQEFTVFLETYFTAKKPKVTEEPLGYVQRRGTDEIKASEVSPDHLVPGSLDQAVARLKHYILSTQDSMKSVEVTFARLDGDRDGVLTKEEFQLGIARMNLGLSVVQVNEIVHLADRSKDGLISYSEFVDFVYDYQFAER
jgi:Ca2+-binding EF-hand superfamily protein